MHYYKFNIADYRKDTAHLSPIEHYIYRQLIDWYYLDEKEIPKKTHSVLRRLSLGSESEANLLNVLSDFFIDGENGWIHGRIDEEIKQYHGNADINRANGKKGGRPKKQQLTDSEKPKKTHSVTDGNRMESEKNPNHKPLTINHKPLTNNTGKEKKFIPPAIEEIKAYCLERRNTVDPQKFHDFYSSKGWMVGKNKMKDWKASVRTWENNGKQEQQKETLGISSRRLN